MHKSCLFLEGLPTRVIFVLVPEFVISLKISNHVFDKNFMSEAYDIKFDLIWTPYSKE